MSAIYRGHKQYFVQYESDRIVCGSYDHPGGNASTIKSAKAIIRNIRRQMAGTNPRNFRVYDSLGEIDEATDFVPCVYAEQ
jgi:hypothetical protein